MVVWIVIQLVLSNKVCAQYRLFESLKVYNFVAPELHVAYSTLIRSCSIESIHTMICDKEHCSTSHTVKLLHF